MAIANKDLSAFNYALDQSCLCRQQTSSLNFIHPICFHVLCDGFTSQENLIQFLFFMHVTNMHFKHSCYRNSENILAMLGIE